MRSSIASSKAVLAVLPVFLLLVAGGLLRAWERIPAEPPPVRTGEWLLLAGQGGFHAMFGGLRSVLAGGFWLQANLAWERRDEAATRRLIELTVAADERPAYYWLNGARMFAYDIPQWSAPTTPEAQRRARVRVGAADALAFLSRGLQWRGPDAELFIEMANLYLHQLGDLEKAAHCYRLAAERPGAPYYAARIHADLLCRLGRPDEALCWLRRVLPRLPAHEPSARRDVVEARIRALEREQALR